MAIERSFSEVAELLSTTRGGYTLWLGAGAAIGLFNRRVPSWNTLVEALEAKYNVKALLWEDYPTRLEHVAQSMGHASFRRALRDRLISPLTLDAVDLDVALALSVIGVRAASVVSFNIEPVSAAPAMLMRGGEHLCWRTFRDARARTIQPQPETGGGSVAPPIYFPHGLLSEGHVVMTDSEYRRHRGSLAVSTAVHLAIGGDLLILGMSLADGYLRDAIMSSRPWIRNIYWLNSSFDFREWARVAHVECVDVPHSQLWSGLSEAVLRADSSEALRKRIADVQPRIKESMQSLIGWDARVLGHLTVQALEVISDPRRGPDEVTAVAELFVGSGFDVPEEVSADARCKLPAR